jgi:hypothetical protein
MLFNSSMCLTARRNFVLDAANGGVWSFMAKKTDQAIETTRALMGALVRMKPEPHDDMKLGAGQKATRSRKTESNQRRKKRRAGLGPDTAAD